MLLNNFRRVLVNTLTNAVSVATGNFTSMTNEIRKTSGNTFTSAVFYRNYPYLTSDFANIANLVSENIYNGDYSPDGNVNFSTCRLALGNGDTPPTIDDYKLSGDLITGLDCQIRSTTVNNNSITFSIIVTNNTSNSVTIKELGLAGCYIQSSNYFTVLLTRDVLPTPVILNTGDSKTLSITIDFRSLTDSTINN